MEVSSYKSLLLFVPNQINLFCLKVNFRQASNCCKSVLEAAKLTMANKRQELTTSQKLGSCGKIHEWWVIC